MTSIIPGEDHLAVTSSVVSLSLATEHLPFPKSFKNPKFPLQVSVLSVAAQPAPSTSHPIEPIACPVNPMDRVALCSSVQHLSTVPLQDLDVCPINAFAARLW